MIFYLCQDKLSQKLLGSSLDCPELARKMYPLVGIQHVAQTAASDCVGCGDEVKGD